MNLPWSSLRYLFLMRQFLWWRKGLVKICQLDQGMWHHSTVFSPRAQIDLTKWRLHPRLLNEVHRLELEQCLSRPKTFESSLLKPCQLSNAFSNFSAYFIFSFIVKVLCFVLQLWMIEIHLKPDPNIENALIIKLFQSTCKYKL